MKRTAPFAPLPARLGRGVAWLLLLSSLGAVVVSQDKPAPDKHTLSLRFDAGFVYTSEESERFDTSVRFEVPQPDGGPQSLTGGATDIHKYTITREAAGHDAEGRLVRLNVAFDAHTLTQSRLKAGESASEQVYNGDGPMLGAAYQEVWTRDRWVRRLERAPRGPFGARPDQLAKELAVQHAARGHPLLPESGVAVGETWKPDTTELQARLARFARWPDDAKPELTAECKLASLEGDIATLEFKLSAKGLSPAKSEAAIEWRRGATCEVAWTATLKLHRTECYVQSIDGLLQVTISGELRTGGEWVPAHSVLKLRTQATTTRARKPE